MAAKTDRRLWERMAQVLQALRDELARRLNAGAAQPSSSTFRIVPSLRGSSEIVTFRALPCLIAFVVASRTMLLQTR